MARIDYSLYARPGLQWACPCGRPYLAKTSLYHHWLETPACAETVGLVARPATPPRAPATPVEEAAMPEPTTGRPIICACALEFDHLWQLERHVDLAHDGTMPVVGSVPTVRDDIPALPQASRLAAAVRRLTEEPVSPPALDLEPYRNEYQEWSCPCGHHYAHLSRFQRHIRIDHGGIIPPSAEPALLDTRPPRPPVPTPAKKCPAPTTPRRSPLTVALATLAEGTCPACDTPTADHLACAICTMWICGDDEARLKAAAYPVCQACIAERKEAQRWLAARQQGRPVVQPRKRPQRRVA